MRRLAQEDEDYNDESKKRKMEESDNHPKTIKMDERGYVHFPTKEWFDLTNEQMTFFKKWNKAIKNGNSTMNLIHPDGIQTINKAQQDDTSKQDESDSSKKRRLNTHDPDSDSDEFVDFE